MFKLISTVDSLLTNTSVKRTPTVGPSLSRSLLLVDSVCNTRLLCAALNVSWRDYISNKELYGDLSPISTSLQIRRLQFSGHCWRSKNETVSQLLLLEPNHGRRSRGHPASTFIDQPVSDTGLSRQDLASVIANRRE